MRIGHGFDVHAFTGGDHVMLGGARIAHTRGVRAHSDGDVVLHALCDALMGAAALGDIGRHFPDHDVRYRGADSRVLLRETLKMVVEAGFMPVNVDITVIAEAPKLAPHVETMRSNIAQDLKLAVRDVNVKATTAEGLGSIGRGEGIAAHAVTLLRELTP